MNIGWAPFRASATHLSKNCAEGNYKMGYEQSASSCQKKNKEENNVMKLRVEVSSSPQSCEIDHSNFDEESRITKDQHVSEIHL